MLNLKNPTKYSDFGKNLFEPVHLKMFGFFSRKTNTFTTKSLAERKEESTKNTLLFGTWKVNNIYKFIDR